MQTEDIQNQDYNEPLYRELSQMPTEPDYPSPNNPPWNSLAALGVWIASVMLIAFLPLVFLLPYAATKNVNLSDNAAVAEFLKNDPNAILLNLLAVFPAHLLTLALAWFVVTRFNTYSFKQTLGWTHNNFKWFYYILIIVGFFAVAGVVNYFLPEQDNDLLRVLRSSRTATLIVAFLATFTAPLVEEVVYRGILYSAVQRTIGVTGAVFIVTTLFALVHVPQYWGSNGTIILICLLSLILTLVRVKTDSLLPCVVLHTIFNGLQSLTLVAEPFLPKDLQQAEQQAGAILHIFK